MLINNLSKIVHFGRYAISFDIAHLPPHQKLFLRTQKTLEISVFSYSLIYAKFFLQKIAILPYFFILYNLQIFTKKNNYFASF